MADLHPGAVRPSLGSALGSAVSRYCEATPNSRARYERACTIMPGGNTRSVLHYDPYPATVARGEGSKLWDIDDNLYTDFLGEYSAGLYGHSNPLITAAVENALHSGLVLCAPNSYEVELADLICARFPSCERVRFCNSGTEANLLAVSAARVHTGRSKIMVFEGAYHGSMFYFAGHHSPINAPFDFVVGEFNNADKSESIIRESGRDLAAVLVEPLQGAAGCIPGDPEFLTALRAATAEQGVMLIFDEVMTSRLSPGGLQQRLGVIPDITTFGKYVGGGLTFGAFGGRRAIMDRFDPRRPDALPHAGTFNNNVLTMAAGLTGLRDIYTPETALAHNERGDAFRDRLNELFRQHDVALHVSGIGSLACLHLQRAPMRSVADRRDTDPRLRTLLHLELLLAGLYLAPRGYMSLSLTLGNADYDSFLNRVDPILSRHADLFR